MVRELSLVPQEVIKKMRYTIPANIADWTKRFSGKPPETVKPPQKQKRKAIVKSAVVKKALPQTKPKPDTKPKPEAKTLVFFKKEPVTFQLRRLEHPADFERILFH